MSVQFEWEKEQFKDTWETKTIGYTVFKDSFATHTQRFETKKMCVNKMSVSLKFSAGKDKWISDLKNIFC